MDAVRWSRIESVFAAAVGLAPAERAAFLSETCDDEALRQEVQALLDADGQAGEFLETPAIQVPDLDQLAQPTLAPGMVLSQRFRLVRFLASGGMGEVYEAEDLELGGHVALKIVRPDLARDTGMMQRFRREVHLARQVTHPSVCRCFDLFHHHGLPEGGPAFAEASVRVKAQAEAPTSPQFGSLGEQPTEPSISTSRTRNRERSLTFLTMELIRGETLAAWLERQGPLTTAEALPIIEQIVAALDAAHARGIVHRDLKAANVMLDRSGPALRVVVMDFGLALSPSNEDAGITGRGQVLGTPACMAPEQLMGAEVSPATDVYALGMLMYRMLTGRTPFEAKSASGATYQRFGAPQPPRDHVPDLDPRWERTILRCLEHLPRARFASAQEVLASLRPAPRLRVQRWQQAAAVLGIALICFMTWTFVLAPHMPAIIARYVQPERPPGPPDFAQRMARELALVDEAVAHEADHAWEKAADCYRELTGFHPRSVGYPLRRAAMLMRAGQLDEARVIVVSLRGMPWAMHLAPRALAEIDLAVAEVTEANALYPFSLDAAKRAVQSSKGLDDRLHGQALYREARARWRLGELDAALEGARSAAAILQTAGDRAGLARALALQANVLDDQAQPEPAAKLYEQAAAIYREIGHLEGIIEVLINLSIVVARKGDADRALTMLDEAAEKAAVVRDRDSQARILFNQAWLHKNRGAYDVALMLYEQALALARDLGNQAIESAALNSKASILRMQGKLEQAAASYRESLRLAKQSGDSEGISSRLNNLALTLRLQGNLPGALQHFDEARGMASFLGDRRGEAQRLTHMGMILRMQGKLAHADARLAQAMEVHAKIDDPDGRAFTLRSLGLLRLAQGKLVEARDVLENAVSLGNLTEAAEILLAKRALAALALEEGDLSRAEVLVQEVIDERTAVAHKDEALDGWLLLARIQLRRARIDKAQEAMRQAGPLAEGSQDFERRLRARLVAAEVDAAAGDRSLAAAKLAAVEKDADGAGMVELRLEVQLARAALTMTDPAARGLALRAVAGEANALGFFIVVKKASALTESPASSRLDQ